MTDEPLRPADTPDSADAAESTGSAATPEELLAETQADDPEVGADGIGMGELP
jgi:hypothetical protein